MPYFGVLLLILLFLFTFRCSLLFCLGPVSLMAGALDSVLKNPEVGALEPFSRKSPARSQILKSKSEA